METSIDQLKRFVCVHAMAHNGLLEKLDEIFSGWHTFDIADEIGEDGVTSFMVKFDEDNEDVKSVHVDQEYITCHRRITEDDISPDGDEEADEVGKWADMYDDSWEGGDGITLCEELDEHIEPIYYSMGAFPLTRKQLVAASRKAILHEIDFYVEGDTKAYKEVVVA